MRLHARRHGVRWHTARSLATTRSSQRQLQRQLAGCRNLQEVIALISEASSQCPSRSAFTPMSLTTAWHRLARHWKPSRGRGAQDLGDDFAAAVHRLTEVHEYHPIETFDTRGLANTLHAWATLQSRTPPDTVGAYSALLPGLIAALEARASELKASELASVVYSLGLLRRGDLGKCDLHADGLLRIACEQALRRQDELGARELPNVIYGAGLAAGQSAAPSVQHALRTLCRKAARESLMSFATQGLSNTLYGLALLRLRDEATLQAFSKHLPQRLGGFKEQELANTVYAFSLMHWVDSSFLHAFCGTAGVGLASFTTQGLAQTVYALGTLGHRDDALLQAAGGEVARRGLRRFNAQDIANIMYSFALLEYVHFEMLAVISRDVPRRVGEFTSQGLANVLYALGLLAYRHDPLLAALSAEMASRISTCTEQHVSNAVWALGLVHREPSRSIAPPVCD
eukprot:TRINITY_DN42569_c0_g1_i2.p1 TRINITY_DN42569_c0_g1~~TRINITY_DN42569_c0_g1_i2.p1  ORF type:complete len:457 (-),score=50.39 TRINITY_DN42569_c0_g1_i2:93-1463(-)